jgi:hypothetical protein
MPRPAPGADGEGAVGHGRGPQTAPGARATASSAELDDRPPRVAAAARQPPGLAETRQRGRRAAPLGRRDRPAVLWRRRGPGVPGAGYCNGSAAAGTKQVLITTILQPLGARAISAGWRLRRAAGTRRQYAPVGSTAACSAAQSRFARKSRARLPWRARAADGMCTGHPALSAAPLPQSVSALRPGRPGAGAVAFGRRGS